MNMKFVRTWAMLALVMVIGLSVTGGTIAWFTDSVSSTNNIIQSGNLDIELEYKLPGDEEWKAVEANTPFFNSTLWEPGHTEAVALRVKNAGTLALKYEMEVKVIEERESTNVYGDTFKLSDHLKVLRSDVQADGAVGDIFMDLNLSSRDNVLGTGSTAAPYTNDFGTKLDLSTAEAQLLPGEARVFSLAVTMPTTVDNVANHKTGVAAPRISFGIELRAAQLQYEKDSFGSDYDADAPFVNDTTTGGDNDDDDNLNTESELPGVKAMMTVRPTDKLGVIFSGIYPDFTPGAYVKERAIGPMTLDFGIDLATTESDIESSPYKKWYIDFELSCSKPLVASEEDCKFTLGGYYAFDELATTGEWLGGSIYGIDLPANTKIRVMDKLMNLPMNYEEIVNSVQDFSCGIKAGDYFKGSTITLDLCAYDPDGTRYQIASCTYEHK